MIYDTEKLTYNLVASNQMRDERNEARTILGAYGLFLCFPGFTQRIFELPDEVIRAVETDKFTSFAILVKYVKYPLYFLFDNHEQMLFDENNKDKYAVLRAIWYILMFSSWIFNFYHPNPL